MPHSTHTRPLGALIRIWPCALMGLLLLILLPPLVSAATQGAQDSRSQTLMSRAMEQGDVRVIMRLKVQTRPEGLLASSASRAAQRANISTVAERVVKRLKAHRLNRVKQFNHLPYVAGSLDARGLEQAMLDPDVAEIYEDKLSRAFLADTTPLIGADTAHAAGYRGAGHAIAILDTGVDKEHPFLAGRVVHEACFSSNSAQQGATSVCPNGAQTQIGAGAGVACTVDDGCSHGTHVAGIVAGANTGSSGVAPDADILAIQVFSRFDSINACGNSTPCTLSFTSDQISALEHVYLQRENFNIAAVNMSLGGGSFSSACDDDPTKAAIDLLRSAGIATVIATGNNGYTSSISSPACISSAISVGSTTKSDTVSSFSNSAQIVDLLAPGSDVRSSITNGGYASFNGTSMATPQVAGAFAVLRSKSPSASVDQLLSTLKNTGRTITDNRNGIAKPRIQLDAAIDALGPSQQGTLTVTPGSGYSVTGNIGGPFNPNRMTYTLANNGTQAIQFAVVENETWVDATPTQGSLAPGADVQVTLSLNTNANSLAPGDYASTVSFENRTNGSGSTNKALSLSVTPPPAQNDKFADSVLLQQSSGSTSGNNVGAQKETGEPAHANNGGGTSVWWRWLAPSAGEVTIDTVGSNFDTILAVYTGSNVTALSEIASNDDAAGTQSRVSFSSQAGAVYQIAVDGYNAASGDISLQWSFSSSTNPGTPIEVTPTSGFSAAGAQGGPFNPASTSYTLNNNSAATKSVQIQGLPSWLTATPSSTTLVPGASTSITLAINASVANTLNAGSYTSTVLFNETGRNVSLTISSPSTNNDNFANAALLSGTNTTVNGSNVTASKQNGEPNHAGNSGGRSVWWRWTSSVNGSVAINTTNSNFDTLLAVYSGGGISNLSSLAANDDDATGGRQSAIEFTASAGSQYYIAVDGYNGASGAIRLNLDARGAIPPSNDRFQNAANLGASPTSVDATNRSATKELSEPDHANNSGGSSVWWRWTASSNGSVQFNTLGSDFDTLLSVYTGTTLATLNEVAANDDYASTRQSRTVITTVAGTTYYIAVDGYGAATGRIKLNLASARPDNDAFADAELLKGLSDSGSVLNFDASREAQEPQHAGRSGGNSVWWRWKSPSTVAIEINTVGSEFDTTLGVYTGSHVSALTLVAANDDMADSNRSKVTFNAVAGTTYRIAVDGYNGATGLVKINIRQDYKILLIDDDGDTSDELNSLYLDSFTALGVTSTLWNTGDGDTEPSAAELAQYRVVLWFTGANSSSTTGPSATTELELQTYLDGGGCVAISSQDYFYAQGLTSFMRNYLGVASAVDDATAGSNLVRGSGPFSDLSETALEFSNNSDRLTPLAPAAAAFIGDQGTLGVHKETSVYKTVFSTLPWAVLDADARQTVLNSLLNYCVGKPDRDLDGVPDDEDNCPTTANRNQDNFDNDDFGDACDADDDNDGLPDSWELTHGLNPRNNGDAGLDFDGDGASNRDEFDFATDPNNPDSDGDGRSDGDEIDADSNPNFNEGSILPMLQLLLDD